MQFLRTVVNTGGEKNNINEVTENCRMSSFGKNIRNGLRSVYVI